MDRSPVSKSSRDFQLHPSHFLVVRQTLLNVSTNPGTSTTFVIAAPAIPATWIPPIAAPPMAAL
jgi:hypothetical protein